MNKIIIEKSKIKTEINKDIINVKYLESDTILAVDTLEIEIYDNDDLEIFYNINNDYKINVNIKIKEKINTTIYEQYIDNNLKIKNCYNIDKNCDVSIQKFYCNNKIHQFDLINLNGENSKIKYLTKSINSEKNKYNLVINHNAKNTNSDVINNGINILNGQTHFDITGYVPKNIINCCLNQVNQIINFNKNKCQINPILLIDENDVIANHSAFIGEFSEEQLFYLQSRGIKYEDAIKLLIKGFMLANLKLNSDNIGTIESKINEYWR